MPRLTVAAALVLVAGASLIGDEVADHINRLGSPRYAERQAATEVLKKMGERALPALEEATKSEDLEVRRRADHLIKTIEGDFSSEFRRFDDFRGPVWCVALSPDGRFAISGCGTKVQGVRVDHSLRLWDVSAGKWLRDLVGAGWLRDASFSLDGQYAAATSDEGTIVWEIRGGDPVRRHLLAGKRPVFLPGGRLLLDSGNVVDVQTSEPVLPLPKLHAGGTSTIVLSADGRRALVAERVAALRDNSTREERERHLRALAVRLVDTNSGEALRRFEGHNGSIIQLAFWPDGRRITSASQDKTVRVWDVGTGKELRRLEVAGVWWPRDPVALSQDGRRALAVDVDGSLSLWGLETGARLRKYHGGMGQAMCLAISADGRFAISGGYDRKVRVWRLPK